MDLGENIRKYRERAGLDQVQLADKLGRTNGAVSQWESGRSTPRMPMIHKMADLFGVTVSELMGDGSEPQGVAFSPTVPVPLVATSHMGGPADDEEPDRTVLFPQEVVERHPGCFAVRAEGGCMDRRYPDGCVLLIDPRMEPRTDDAVMARFPDGRSVVRVYMPGSSVLMLSPDSWSSTYDDIIVRQDDDPVELAGVVVWYMAEMDIVR